MLGSRLGRFFVIAGLNVVPLAVLAIGFETAFGSWLLPYVPPRSAIVDRTLTFRQFLYDPPSVVTYVRDRYALRGVRGPLENVKLVTLGGSTTDQRFITEGETWQDVIGALTGLPVANAGIDGMSSTGHILALQEWLHPIPRLRARIYLHFIGVNDAWLPDKLVPPDRSGTSSWITWLRLRSAHIQAAARSWAWIRGAVEVRHGRVVPHQLDAFEPIKAKVDRKEIYDFVEARYKPNLRRLLDLHDANGERAIFVSQPVHPAVVLHRGDDVFMIPPLVTERWAVAIGIVNAATEDVCRRRLDTCAFIDVAGRLAFEQEDFYDSVHVTPAGARKLGEYLAKELIELTKADSEFSNLLVGKKSGMAHR
jgi:hypothetical protein